jgi:molecular chaperone DnaJ
VSPREWVEKDFYATLGVGSTSSADEIKKAYRKLARELHPDAHPGDTKAEQRFKEVSEAYSVLADPDKRKEYDETRTLFSSGAHAGGRGFPGFGGGASSGARNFGVRDFSDLFEGGGSASFSDIFGGAFRDGRSARGAASRPGSRARRGNDLETETTLGFREAARGVTIPLRITSQVTCETCRGSGARKGTAPRKCSACEGSGLVTRQEGSFGFTEPCAQCRGAGQIIDDPCPDCHGTGLTTRSRTITMRVPPGVHDGQRIRLAEQGEPGTRGGGPGDLYVTVHVEPDAVFTRDGDDLRLTVPVRFTELALGATVTVPTLDGKVGVRVPAGTADGRTLRVRGKGVAKRGGGAGDLLVTLQVSVPVKLDEAALESLRKYAASEEASGFDPRANWAGSR